ncbi:hypothetical protein [Asanoa iriomotensis]|uniref:Secreted protein n=1 Tax=Asanoa iriomotensis TaxID=234613 RepID=A0ABQ4C1A3_9ACTN|nr:hypothetical protein [Asanoa iriomotensis]GIF56554.1 hypothetical protein Air01nite_26490 [Asanoa iriomotensis]
MRSKVFTAFALTVATVVATIAWAAPAQAAPVSNFNVSGNPNSTVACHATQTIDWGCTEGQIEWHNRTATVYPVIYPSGWRNCTGHLYTEVVFESFAGSKKIHTVTRVAYCVHGWYSEPGFTIGDTNLVGGINRVKITLCNYTTNDGRTCGQNENYSKPAS